MNSSLLTRLASLFTKAAVPVWLKFLPYAIAVAMAAGWFWQYTAKVKLEATHAADAKWEKRIQEFDELARKRVDEVWKQSTNFANNAETASRRQAAEVKRILQVIDVNAPSGQYLELKDGQCVFKPEYVDAFNRIRNTLPGATK